MKVFTVHHQGRDRIELFSNNTGMGFVDGRIYPLDEEDFKHISERVHSGTFDLKSYVVNRLITDDIFKGVENES
jgi:hypothetical protein